MQDKDITIVTAFFDIGRGNIQRQHAPSHMTRTVDTYFEYFSNLAQLENNMVIFTSQDFASKIKEIRKDKPTTVIVFDFHHKLKHIKKQISEIQNSQSYINKIRPDLINNIEYWSADYVLINNLKTYFVNRAISQNIIQTNLVAWVDFGYVRSLETLNHIKNWQYNFDPNFIHLFTIKNKRHIHIKNYSDVLDFIFNNQVSVIGGGIVGTQEKWQKFLKLLYQNQKELLKQGIVDDDQGLYMMCLLKNPNLFQLNYLGKKQWFSLFKKYDQTSKIPFIEKIKDKIF